MNYRHAYHAGNIADVFKHLVLVRVIEYLKQKAKPFCFVDSHAGTGLYDLSGDEAARSGEWRDGVGRLVEPRTLRPSVELTAELAALVGPYFDVLAAVNASGEGQAATDSVRAYPGAASFARHLLRQNDRIVVNELHPEDAHSLRRVMRRDDRVRVLQLDGWTVVRSVLPPKERRGILLIDPPFEEPGEFARLEQALADATARFASGVTLLWFPIKAGGASAAFCRRMAASGHHRLLLAEVLIRHPDTPVGLNGSGLVIHNPPYGLDRELGVLLPWLLARLAPNAGAACNVEWLVAE